MNADSVIVVFVGSSRLCNQRFSQLSFCLCKFESVHVQLDMSIFVLGVLGVLENGSVHIGVFNTR